MRERVDRVEGEVALRVGRLMQVVALYLEVGYYLRDDGRRALFTLDEVVGAVLDGRLTVLPPALVRFIRYIELQEGYYDNGKILYGPADVYGPGSGGSPQEPKYLR